MVGRGISWISTRDIPPFSRTCMDGVCVVDEVVPPPEGLVAELALEALSAVHRLDVRVQAPLAHQSPAAGA